MGALSPDEEVRKQLQRTLDVPRWREGGYCGAFCTDALSYMEYKSSIVWQTDTECQGEAHHSCRVGFTIVVLY